MGPTTSITGWRACATTSGGMRRPSTLFRSWSGSDASKIDFIRPARADQEITITSFVREFRGPDALIDCVMVDGAGKELSRCLMTVAYVDRATDAREGLARRRRSAVLREGGELTESSVG